MSDDVEVISTGLNLDENAVLMHETAKEKGFWPEKYYTKGEQKVSKVDGQRLVTQDSVVTEEAICTKIALIHSEGTEVLEAVRKNQGEDKIVEEMSDIIIRTLDLYAALRNTGQVTASLDEITEAKMLKNSVRPRLHGNRF